MVGVAHGETACGGNAVVEIGQEILSRVVTPHKIGNYLILFTSSKMYQIGGQHALMNAPYGGEGSGAHGWPERRLGEPRVVSTRRQPVRGLRPLRARP